jgi:UDP-N-acetylmuramoyl-L-alanyl-D-glutamate--2,6-diaminopimelate ligase
MAFVMFFVQLRIADGLENILSSVRQHTAGAGSRLHVVFGCGGNRDSTKRPMMGAIAQRLADVVVCDR